MYKFTFFVAASLQNADERIFCEEPNMTFLTLICFGESSAFSRGWKSRRSLIAKKWNKCRNIFFEDESAKPKLYEQEKLLYIFTKNLFASLKGLRSLS